MSPFILGVFLSSLGDLWAFIPIYSPAKAAANSNVPFSLEAKILGTLQRKILVGLFGQQMDLTVIHCDNLSCIKLSVNLVFHDRLFADYLDSVMEAIDGRPHEEEERNFSLLIYLL